MEWVRQRSASSGRWWTRKRTRSSIRNRHPPRRVFSHPHGSTHPNPNLERQPPFPTNRVRSSKYTLVSFLPVNLFEQFSRAANFYFLILMTIALIPGIAPVTPITSVLPLVFVITVTAIKQGYEDYKRHVADNETNLQPAHVLQQDGTIKDVYYEDVVVGDIVKVVDGEDFPCDLVLLSSPIEGSQCFITTANLDGESNLKIRTSAGLTSGKTNAELADSLIWADCEFPHANLYAFNGRLSMASAGAPGRRSSRALELHRMKSTESMTDDWYIVGEQDISEHPEYDQVPFPKSVRGRVQLYDGRPVLSEDNVCGLNAQNLLLKGARLRNTPYVYALAVYTGMDSKLMLNQRKPRFKFSSVEMRLNVFLGMFFLLLIMTSVVSAIFYLQWIDESTKFWPIMLSQADYPKRQSLAGVEYGFRQFLTFCILYSYIVPIALYVSLEMQKFVGGLLVGWDRHMYCPLADLRCAAKTSDIIEELGQIEYIFTDKTGTLTQNSMEFRKCTIHCRKYNFDSGALTHVERPEERGCKETAFVEGSDAELQQAEFFIALALCHTVQIEEEGYEDEAGSVRVRRKYTSVSPDEEALVLAAKQAGVVFEGRTDNELHLTVHGKACIYRLIHVLDFSSDRMRMSVLVQDEQGQYILYSKGADATVLPRTALYDQEDARSNTELQLLIEDLDAYSCLGLRTLVVAKKIISEEEFATVRLELKSAVEALDNRASLLCAAYNRLEATLVPLGVTAVEDKLQVGVMDTMRQLHSAGIKLWVLTGDKIATAKNISIAAGHISQHTIQLDCTGLELPDGCKALFDEYINEIETGGIYHDRARFMSQHESTTYGSFNTEAAERDRSGEDLALILDGITINTCITYCPEKLRTLTSKCESVLCCRLSPLQKAQIVELVREGAPIPGTKRRERSPVTLAVGDGANDVAMIIAAHIGVGIFGKEGRQAARASDFAFAQFRFLSRLILVHGHFSYYRIAYSIQFFFYKNMVFFLPLLYFGPRALFSSQTLFDAWQLMLWSTMFTALPILLFGIFEMDLSPRLLLEYPGVHQALVDNQMLSLRTFALWMIEAAWHGSIAYYGTIFLWDDVVHTETSLWLVGTAIYTVVFVIVTLRISLDFRNWTHVTAAGIYISMLSYIGFMLLYCGIVDVFGSSATTGGMYQVFYVMVESRSYWKSLLLLLFTALFPGFVLSYALRLFSPTAVQLVQMLDWRTNRKGWICLRTLEGGRCLTGRRRKVVAGVQGEEAVRLLADTRSSASG